MSSDLKELYIEDLGQISGGIINCMGPDLSKLTTLAVGEEDGGSLELATTLAIGEEDGGLVATTMAIGEEDGGFGLR